MRMAAPNPFNRADYLLAAHTHRQLPPDGGREVAFAGRSNAGKSSALNALCGSNALARVSKTPGRTQQLVYFGLPPHESATWSTCRVTATPRSRRTCRRTGRRSSTPISAAGMRLRGLVVVMDIRHPLKDYDRSDARLRDGRGLPAHALLTKADKLSPRRGR
jgi:GTP-binding protein